MILGEKNLHSPQAQTILSDIFKIPSDEKEISWEDFLEMSHKITRIIRHFFASKHSQPQNELISYDFIEKDSVQNLCVSSKVLIFVVN